MPPNPSADGPASQWGWFTCDWRREGPGAASVIASGEVDIATAHRLEDALRDALGHARLVLLDLYELSFIDCTGLRVILGAAARAHSQDARIVLTGASAQFETLLDLTGTRRHLERLQARSPEDETPWVAEDERSGWSPFDNPVNDRVAGARVMAVPDDQMWVQLADGTIHRPWASPAEGFRVPPGTQLEIYFDAAGTVNGWYDPRSGLAINQRGLDPGDSPATHSDLACQGPCGLVWRAPAAARLRERHERCLTCAGSLALR